MTDWQDRTGQVIVIVAVLILSLCLTVSAGIIIANVR